MSRVRHTAVINLFLKSLTRPLSLDAKARSRFLSELWLSFLAKERALCVLNEQLPG